jgi:hypothetical protein
MSKSSLNKTYQKTTTIAAKDRIPSKQNAKSEVAKHIANTGENDILQQIAKESKMANLAWGARGREFESHRPDHFYRNF